MAVSGKWTWADFWRRCRSRTVSGEEDAKPLLYRVLLPWIIFCLLGMVLIDTEDGLFQFAARMVPFTSALPWIAFFGFLSYCATPRRPLKIEPVILNFFGLPLKIKPLIWMAVWPVVVGIFLGYMTIGIFDWFNALAGSHETVLVRGPVIAKAKGGSSRYGGVGSYLSITFEHRLVSLKVPAQDYKQIHVGDEYAVKMKRGALGYFYRWPRVFSSG